MLRFEQDEVVTFKGDLNNLLSGQKKPDIFSRWNHFTLFPIFVKFGKSQKMD